MAGSSSKTQRIPHYSGPPVRHASDDDHATQSGDGARLADSAAATRLTTRVHIRDQGFPGCCKGANHRRARRR